jgi:hypothetical protein
LIADGHAPSPLGWAKLPGTTMMMAPHRAILPTLHGKANSVGTAP